MKNMNGRRRAKRSVRVLWALVVPLILASCGGTVVSSSDSSEASNSVSTDPSTGGDAAFLSIRDAWVKAADTGTTAAFGVLTNAGKSDVVIRAATSDASPIMELHETVTGASGTPIMRPKEGGFTIPAGGEFLLQPGANHLMLMALVKPLQAGQSAKFALAMADGSTFTFSAVAKEFSGANESYEPGSTTTLAGAASTTTASVGGVTVTSPRSSTSAARPNSTEAPRATQAASVSVVNTWVKTANSGMSAAFGELRNTGDREVTLTAAVSDASPVMELHETVDNGAGQRVMRRKQGGFVIPAQSTFALQPGANHLMLMNVVNPFLPGSAVQFTLTFADGSTLIFSALAKDYSGANETYVP